MPRTSALEVVAGAAHSSSLLNLMVGVAIFQPGDVGTAPLQSGDVRSALQLGFVPLSHALPGIGAEKGRQGLCVLSLAHLATTAMCCEGLKPVEKGSWAYDEKQHLMLLESRLLCLRGEYLKAAEPAFDFALGLITDFELGQVVLSRPAEIWIGAEGGSLSVLSAQHVARFWPQAADAHEAGFKAAEWHALDSSGG
ncbi:hypothetical protein AK812_SmicGene4156 [Symbiodinium microadriaticum]|uniref:Uncharacterized protein n=1 Tax=Symbiodinium microadriaticum TaxID=2951 RepID=A0A1Q9EX30_SYMMI|nr:hypothetical protein AK812_SmicGene4156 [Symbiodinium microadriaticum]